MLIVIDEKINLETGMTEETQFYNDSGEQIGHMKVNRKRRMEVPAKFRSRMASGITATAQPQTLKFDVPEESEVEMNDENGKSTTKVKMANVKVNENVEFKWRNVKTEVGK